MDMAGNSGKRPPPKRKDPPPSLDLKGQSSLSATAAPFKLPGVVESAAGEQGTKASEAAAEPPPSNELQPHSSEATVSPTQTTRTPRSARLPASDRCAPGIPATPGIEQSGIDSTESNAEARLAKQKNEFDTAQQEWYDEITGAEEKARESEEHRRKAEEEKSKFKKQAEDRVAEAKNLAVELDELKRENETKAKARNAKVQETKDRDAHVKELQDELAKALSDLKDGLAAKKKLQERNDDFEAQRIGLHEEIDKLKKARDDAIGVEDENGEAREALVELNAKFEEMFKDLGKDLSMNDYVEHVRTLQQHSRLRRDDSRASMASDAGDPQALTSGRRGNRHVSTASMAAELEGQESDSEADIDVEDQDLTITSGDQFSKWQISHGDEPQSVRNPAVPGSLESAGADELYDEWQHKRTQTPGDGFLTDAGTSPEAGTSANGTQPWHVTHGEESQSVSNPALPGQAEMMGEDEMFGEWRHVGTQTPPDTRAAQGQRPPVPPPAQTNQDEEIRKLKVALGRSNMLLKQRDEDRRKSVLNSHKLSQEQKELEQKLTGLENEMQALRQSRVPVPAPTLVRPMAVNQGLGFSGTQTVANIPPSAPPQAAATTLGFSGTQNIANIPPSAPPQPTPVTLGFSGTQTLASIPPSAPPQAAATTLGFSGTQNIANIPPSAPPQPTPVTLGFSGTQTVADSPPSAPAQAATTSARPQVASRPRHTKDATTQTLAPKKPQAPPQLPPRVMTRTVTVDKVPQSLPELFKALPWWLQLVLGLLLAALVGWTMQVAQERHFWLSANDQGHEQLVRLTDASSRYGWLLGLEELMGVDRQGALLG